MANNNNHKRVDGMVLECGEEEKSKRKIFFIKSLKLWNYEKYKFNWNFRIKTHTTINKQTEKQNGIRNGVFLPVNEVDQPKEKGTKQKK